MHQAIVAQLALERAIQARPPLLLHLALQGLLDLQLGAWPQPFGRQFGGAMAEAVRDVVARDDEVFAGVVAPAHDDVRVRSEEHTSELQSLMRISYAVFCLKKKRTQTRHL